MDIQSSVKDMDAGKDFSYLEYCMSRLQYPVYLCFCRCIEGTLQNDLVCNNRICYNRQLSR